MKQMFDTRQTIPKEQCKVTMKRNLQHREHKTKTNKTKTQHNMCWTPLYANIHIFRN